MFMFMYFIIINLIVFIHILSDINLIVFISICSDIQVLTWTR